MADKTPDRAPDAASASADVPAARVESAVQTVRVRRAPKLVVFLVLGAALGFLAALVLTFALHADAEAEQGVYSAMSYTKGQIFGYLALVGVAAGAALGAIVAVVLDWAMRRRSRTAMVDRESVTTAH